jgi:hypothetical protein
MTNPNPKRPLTSGEVAQIKSRWAAGESEVDLAEAFDRSQRSISLLLTGKTYQHSHGSSHFRNLHLVDGEITWRELRDAALEYDECGLPDTPSFERALDFVLWLRAEVRGVAA